MAGLRGDLVLQSRADTLLHRRTHRPTPPWTHSVTATPADRFPAQSAPESTPTSSSSHPRTQAGLCPNAQLCPHGRRRSLVPGGASALALWSAPPPPPPPPTSSTHRALRPLSFSRFSSAWNTHSAIPFGSPHLCGQRASADTG